MPNLIRIFFLIFALGVLAAPLLDRSGALEEFAFALAEDAADQDAHLALPQFLNLSDNQSDGPAPLFSGISSRTETVETAIWSRDDSAAPTPAGFSTNRPLYLLYHNFLFYDCLAS